MAPDGASMVVGLVGLPLAVIALVTILGLTVKWADRRRGRK